MSYTIEQLRAAYLAGFNSSAEGWNGEYPFQDFNQDPEKYKGWIQKRNEDLGKVIA